MHYQKTELMLSKKTRYAMLALTNLASKYGDGAIQISDIAKKENILYNKGITE